MAFPPDGRYWIVMRHSDDSNTNRLVSPSEFMGLFVHEEVAYQSLREFIRLWPPHQNPSIAGFPDVLGWSSAEQFLNCNEPVVLNDAFGTHLRPTAIGYGYLDQHANKHYIWVEQHETLSTNQTTPATTTATVNMQGPEERHPNSAGESSPESLRATPSRPESPRDRSTTPS